MHVICISEDTVVTFLGMVEMFKIDVKFLCSEDHSNQLIFDQFI